MKKLFLVCNAHIDPVWLWNKNDTVGATLSTFRSAVKLLDEYDFVFCHNESILYEIVSKYDKPLFKRITELIKEGRWHIMGGWNIQPDCNMPSGETMIRHMLTGREYFKRSFDVAPTVAVNFDPFGHNKGLVKLLAISGYDGYIITRPHPDESDIPEHFIWKNGRHYVRVIRPDEAYNNLMGEAADKAKKIIKADRSEVELMLWGVGNHGGGPSRQDLEDLERLKSETDVEIIHSTPEEYFANASFTEVVDKSLSPCMPGCYTSQTEVKQTFRRLESEYYLTEKMCAHASFETSFKYPEKELATALRDLLFADFHDILPGTAIKEVEQASIADMHYALKILKELKFDALYSLTKDLSYAPDCYPFFVYNPLPYEVTVPMFVEFTLKNQNHSDTIFTDPQVFVEGVRCPSQVVKESSNINLDWIKRVCFECTLRPMSASRIEIFEKLVEGGRYNPVPAQRATVKNKTMTVDIDGSTGLFNILDGERAIVRGGGEIAVIKDNPDPWAMGHSQLSGLGDKIGEFEKIKDEDAKAFISAVKTSGKNFRIIEDGELLTRTEVMLEYGRSTARVRYTVYKSFNYMDIDVSVVANEKDKAFKLCIPVEKGSLSGEIMYDREVFEESPSERVAQRYLSLDLGDKCLNIYNKGTYGFSYHDGRICLNLLRQASYSAHPLEEKPFVHLDRMSDTIDVGSHSYSFRIELCDREDCAKNISVNASLFNAMPYMENLWPVGEGREIKPFAELESKEIELSAMYRKGQTYVVRLYNNAVREVETVFHCAVLNVSAPLKFEANEIKTLVIKRGEVAVTADPMIL